MARRRKKKGSRKKDKAIPILMLAPIFPAVARVAAEGVSSATPKVILFETLGYSMDGNEWNMGRVYRQAGLSVGALVGHKVANKIGLNRALKKATMGYLCL